MALREQAIKGVVWSAVRNWGSRTVRFAVFLVLARLLTPAAFGLVALAGVYIALVQVFVDQGFADALIQREELTPAHLDTAFWTSLGMGALLAGATLLTAGPVADLFVHLNQTTTLGPAATEGAPPVSLQPLGPVIRWLALSFPLAALISVQEALFERDLDYRVLAVRSLVAMAAGGGVGIAMATSGYGVWSLVGYQLTERAVAAVVLWTASDWRPGLRWRLARFRELFSFGVNVVGTSLLDFFNRRLDNLLVGIFLGTTALGFYDIAYRLLTVGTQLVTQTISSVAFSTFSRLQDDLERMRRAFYTATRLVGIVAFPVFVGGALLAPELVEVIFGAKWLPSAPVFRILALIGVLHAVFYFKAGVLLAAGKPDWRLGISVVNTIGNAVAFALTVRWGIVAVAAGYVTRGYVLAPLMLVAVRTLIGLRWRTYFGTYYAPLVSTAAMAGAVWGLKLTLAAPWPPLAVLLAGVPLGAAVYVLTFWVVEPERLLKVRDLARDALPTASSSG